VFIYALKPVTYNVDVVKQNEFLYQNYTPRYDSAGNLINPKPFVENNTAIHTGFLAQDVEKAAKELGFEFDGVDAPKNASDYYGLRYGQFVVPLVQAVQELSKENEELKKQNAEILKRLEALENK
jgi:trimeric autotransporter adhesin